MDIHPRSRQFLIASEYAAHLVVERRHYVPDLNLLRVISCLQIFMANGSKSIVFCSFKVSAKLFMRLGLDLVVTTRVCGTSLRTQCVLTVSLRFIHCDEPPNEF